MKTLVRIFFFIATSSLVRSRDYHGRSRKHRGRHDSSHSSSSSGKRGPGYEVTIGVDASVWDSSIPLEPLAGIYPIGGNGQINGQFTISTLNGIELGIRVQERFKGPVPAVADGDVGVYQANTGPSDPVGTPAGAWWNYDIHFDARNASGKFQGKTLGDFSFIFYSTTFQAIVCHALDMNVLLAGAENAVLFQQSQNPLWVPPFDENAEDVYELSLILKPETFRGPKLRASMRVNVVNP